MLEADSAAMRREVAALRAERAHVVLALERAHVVVAADRPRFSLLAICTVRTNPGDLDTPVVIITTIYSTLVQ